MSASAFVRRSRAQGSSGVAQARRVSTLDAALSRKLSDQAAELGAAQAGEFAQEAAREAFAGARLAGAVLAPRDGVNEGVLGCSRAELEADGLASIEERSDLLQVQCFGLLHGDSHRPRLLWLLPSLSRLQAHLVLDKTPRPTPARSPLDLSDPG